MKIKIKLFTLFLIALMILQAVSCKKEDTATTDTSSAEEIVTTEPSAEQVTTGPLSEDTSFEKMLLAEGGETFFKIINSKAADSALQYEVDVINNRLYACSGTYFKKGDDSKYVGVDYSAKHEILIGTADRDACRQVYASIGYDGYAVKHVGNKIVIAAYTRENLLKAEDLFFSECISVEGKGSSKTVCYVKDIVYKGTAGLFFTEENPLSSYTVVCNDKSAGFASRFVMAIEEHSGISLNVAHENEPAVENEIIIGDTIRPESADAAPLGDGDYRVKAVGKKIAIRSNSASISYSLIDVITNDFMSSPTLNFPANVDVSKIRYVGEDRQTLTNGADIRVMSFNILNEKWAENHDPYPRVHGIVGCVNYYKPDVVGFQEISEKWYEILTPLFPDYVFVNKDLHGGTDNAYTVVAYRKDTVEFIIEDLLVYSKCTNNRLRILNSAVLEHKATGKRFIVTSTHLDVTYPEHREVQATEHLQRVEKLIRAYQCPVISTGDYNSREGSKPHANLIYNGVMNYAKTDALEKGAIHTTGHGLGSKPGESATSIDQIFYTKGVIPLYYTTLLDPYVLESSDHTPIICDFKFN